jgi:hypothetical protein
MRIFFVLILLFIFSNCSDSKVSNYNEIEKVFEQDSIKYEKGYIKTH